MERTPPPREVESSAAARTLPWLVAMGTVALLAVGPVVETDLGFHLATGRYILEHGVIPSTNVLSFAEPNAPSVNDEWLVAVIDELAFRLGPPAIVLVRVSLLLATFSALFAAAGMADSDSHRARRKRVRLSISRSPLSLLQSHHRVDPPWSRLGIARIDPSTWSRADCIGWLCWPAASCGSVLLARSGVGQLPRLTHPHALVARVAADNSRGPSMAIATGTLGRSAGRLVFCCTGTLPLSPSSLGRAESPFRLGQ